MDGGIILDSIIEARTSLLLPRSAGVRYEQSAKEEDGKDDYNLSTGSQSITCTQGSPLSASHVRRAENAKGKAAFRDFGGAMHPRPYGPPMKRGML